VADPVSLTINREIANAIFEGARNARGGERQFAAGHGLAESNLHLFEPVQLVL
jgi:hypothetical protein